MLGASSSILSRLSGVCCALLVGGAALPAAAQTYISFTGTDGTGLLTGTAEVNAEGYEVSVLAFNATFTNLLADGASIDTVTFTEADVADGYWFESGPDGTTFTFDLNGTGPDQAILSGIACYFACFTLQGNGFESMFTTSVTDYSDTPPSVPEPASVAVFGVGLLGMAGLGRHLSIQRRA